MLGKDFDLNKSQAVSLPFSIGAKKHVGLDLGPGAEPQVMDLEEHRIASPPLNLPGLVTGKQAGKRKREAHRSPCEISYTRKRAGLLIQHVADTTRTCNELNNMAQSERHAKLE